MLCRPIKFNILQFLPVDYYGYSEYGTAEIAATVALRVLQLELDDVLVGVERLPDAVY